MATQLTLKEVLGKAVQKEVESRLLYIGLSQKVNDEAAKDALQELARQEQGHQNLLEQYLRGELAEGAMKIKIVFYSMYGHIYRMAEAVAEGAREVEGAEVELLQVPELVPDDVLEKSGAKKAREVFAHIPVAKVSDLADADAIIFGTPTRYGNMCAQMCNETVKFGKERRVRYFGLVPPAIFE